MKNSSNLSLMSQSVGNNTSTGIGGGHNVLNEKEDMIGRHNGFEKRTFGYVPHTYCINIIFLFNPAIYGMQLDSIIMIFIHH